MERVRKEISAATMKFVGNGKHSPHSEEAAFAECNFIAGEFLKKQLH
jgi:hypothetical protein